MTPCISVIIPVYNAEKYIAQCLDSILNQTFQDFEAIVVDDGSTDGSVEICRKYAKQDNRIKFIGKSNGGVSSARNVALAHANGKYVTFLDADDMFYPDCMEQCYGILEANQLDLLQFSLSRVYDKLRKKELLQDIKVYNSAEFFNLRHNVSAGANFIRRTTILENSIKFNETIKLAEDQLFILNVIKHSRRLAIIPSVLYYYRTNENSATHTSKDDDVLQTCSALYTEKMTHPEFAHQLDNTILNLTISIVAHSRNKTNIKRIAQFYKNANVKHCDRVPRVAKYFYMLACVNVHLAVYLLKLHYNY